MHPNSDINYIKQHVLELYKSNIDLFQPLQIENDNYEWIEIKINSDELSNVKSILLRKPIKAPNNTQFNSYKRISNYLSKLKCKITKDKLALLTLLSLIDSNLMQKILNDTQSLKNHNSNLHFEIYDNILEPLKVKEINNNLKYNMSKKHQPPDNDGYSKPPLGETYPDVFHSFFNMCGPVNAPQTAPHKVFEIHASNMGKDPNQIIKSAHTFANEANQFIKDGSSLNNKQSNVSESKIDQVKLEANLNDQITLANEHEKLYTESCDSINSERTIGSSNTKPLNPNREGQIMSKNTNPEILFEIYEKIKEGYNVLVESTRSKSNKMKIVITGLTGEGKTTLGHLLTNEQLQIFIQDNDIFFEQVNSSNSNSRNIGNLISRSETSIPNKFTFSDIDVWDLPGNNDSSGPKQNIINLFNTLHILQPRDIKDKEFKFILTVSHQTLLVSRGQLFKEYLEQFVNNFNDINEIVKSSIIVITKVSKNYNIVDIQNKLAKFINDESNKYLSDEANNLLNNLISKTCLFYDPGHEEEGMVYNTNKLQASPSAANIMEYLEDFVPSLEGNLNPNIVKVSLKEEDKIYCEELAKSSLIKLVDITSNMLGLFIDDSNGKLDISKIQSLKNGEAFLTFENKYKIIKEPIFKNIAKYAQFFDFTQSDYYNQTISNNNILNKAQLLVNFLSILAYNIDDKEIISQLERVSYNIMQMGDYFELFSSIIPEIDFKNTIEELNKKLNDYKLESEKFLINSITNISADDHIKDNFEQLDAAYLLLLKCPSFKPNDDLNSKISVFYTGYANYLENSISRDIENFHNIRDKYIKATKYIKNSIEIFEKLLAIDIAILDKTIGLTDPIIFKEAIECARIVKKLDKVSYCIKHYDPAFTSVSYEEYADILANDFGEFSKARTYYTKARPYCNSAESKLLLDVKLNDCAKHINDNNVVALEKIKLDIFQSPEIEIDVTKSLNIFGIENNDEIPSVGKVIEFDQND